MFYHAAHYLYLNQQIGRASELVDKALKAAPNHTMVSYNSLN